MHRQRKHRLPTLEKTVCLFRVRERYDDRRMVNSREDFCQDILRGNGKRGGIDARVAADPFGFRDRLVDDELHGVLHVVHKAKHAN